MQDHKPPFGHDFRNSAEGRALTCPDAFPIRGYNWAKPFISPTEMRLEYKPMFNSASPRKTTDNKENLERCCLYRFRIRLYDGISLRPLRNTASAPSIDAIVKGHLGPPASLLSLQCGPLR